MSCAEAIPPSTGVCGVRSAIARTIASASTRTGSTNSSHACGRPPGSRSSAGATSSLEASAIVVASSRGRLSVSSETAGCASASTPGPITPCPLAPTRCRTPLPARSRASTSS